MRKDIVGDWGSALGDADYACALAALGALESQGTEQHGSGRLEPAQLGAALKYEFAAGERTPRWRGVRSVSTRAWRETVHADAAALATAWQQYVHDARGHSPQSRRSPRLAVRLFWRKRTDLFDFETLCGWLKRPEVGLDALVLADESPRLQALHGVAWHWPVRVGVPAGPEDGAMLAALRAARDGAFWVRHLCEFYAVGAGRDACDVLILTPAAMQRLLAEEQAPHRLRASIIVCLDDPPLHVSEVGEDHLAVRDRLRAAGLALVGRVDPPAIADWFTAVLGELAHDLPIHAAVHVAARSRLGRDPLIVGDPALLDKCRIVALAARQDRLVAQLRQEQQQRGGEESLGPDPTFGVPDLPPPIDRTQTHWLHRPGLADELRVRSFTAEGVDGVASVDDLARRADAIDQARGPRWIQANGWRSDALESPARALAPEQWNLISVHIGPSETPRGVPFPESGVDFSGGDVTITVQLELAGATLVPVQARQATGISGRPHNVGDLIAALTQQPRKDKPAEPAVEKDATSVGLASTELRLPPVGDSTLALFGVRPQTRALQLTGRIAVVHNNRILQTARLTIDVNVGADQGTGLIVIPEGAIHPRDDDLDQRREYDVAIQVSDVGGKLHLTFQRNGIAIPVQLDDLEQPISGVRKALEQAALRWDYTKPMAEQGVVLQETLFSLAAHGSAVEQELRKKCGNDIDRWERIHLVPATNEFLPLEYVYDGRAPNVRATVCPNMLDALGRGSCSGGPGAVAADCPNQRDGSFLCPMHFWGFRRLIERSGTISSAAPTASVPSKRLYGRIESVLFAASRRAFAYATNSAAQNTERAALVQALGALSHAVVDAADWDDWRDQISKKGPNLLVLLAHTDQYLGTPVLEIGDGQFLGRAEIQQDLSGPGGRPQLLILLGCSAAGVSENFQPYPERFRDAGVSIVLAPVAPIRGAEAVQIAKRLAQRLADRLAMGEPAAFGDLLPLLRRELLREGRPGVMGLVGFGDGDWLLGGA
jgi:hypothetical protein